MSQMFIHSMEFYVSYLGRIRFNLYSIPHLDLFINVFNQKTLFMFNKNSGS